MNQNSQNGAYSEEKSLNLLGLARRAGRLSLGTEGCFTSITSGSAQLVFLAADAGDNTAKKFRDKCAFYHTPLVERFNRFQLGHACGRKELVVLTVNDPGFAAKLRKMQGITTGGVAFDETESL